MVSKNQKKLIKSLYQKKYRKQHGLFVAEGRKVIQEFLEAGYNVYALFTTDPAMFVLRDVYKVYEVTPTELKSISFLTTAPSALAVFYMPEPRNYKNDMGLTLALDDIRDPGNLGTIIRLCDWFGISSLVCSKNTVDCYNPKVIQATMGSVTRVSIYYEDLFDFISDHQENSTVFGTFLEGDSIYETDLPKQGIIVMGNEANGISESIRSLVTKKVTIPQFGSVRKTESLNVATATAIILSEFCRK